MFLEHFHDIAAEHIEAQRAKAFAFIFYDFLDYEFKTVLKDAGVFAQLDRLSGNDLSIFYLHSGSHHDIREFNRKLMQTFGIAEQARMPCVVFCKTSGVGFSDVFVANLESVDLIHGFHELYGVIESYVTTSRRGTAPRHWQWVRGSLKFVSLEVIKVLVREALKIPMS